MMESQVENVSFQVRINATTHSAGQEFPLDSISKQIKIVHGLILSEFDALFTIKAKNSFKPYDDDNYGQ